MIERCRVDELIKEACSSASRKTNRETFCPESKGKNFYGVGYRQRRVGQAVGSREKENNWHQDQPGHCHPMLRGQTGKTDDYRIEEHHEKR